MPICEVDEEYKLVWSYNFDGEYLVKLGYQMLRIKTKSSRVLFPLHIGWKKIDLEIDMGSKTAQQTQNIYFEMFH